MDLEVATTTTTTTTEAQGALSEAMFVKMTRLQRSSDQASSLAAHTDHSSGRENQPMVDMRRPWLADPARRTLLLIILVCYQVLYW